MAFSDANPIVQTGTDSGTLSALGELSSVTTTVIGGLTIYTTAVPIYVDGDLTVDGVNSLIVSSAPSRGLYAQNGTLRLGAQLSGADGFLYYPKVEVFRSISDPVQWFAGGVKANTDGALAGGADGTIIINEAIITLATGTTANAFSFEDCTLVINNGVILTAQGIAREGREIISGIHTANATINGLTVIGGELVIGEDSATSVLNGITRQDSAIGIFPNRVSDITFPNVNAGGQGNVVDITIQTAAELITADAITHTKLPDSATGNNLKIIGAQASSFLEWNIGCARIQKNYKLTPRNVDGDIIVGGKLYIGDTDHGQRKNLNGLDDTADKVYEATSIATGFPQILIDTAIVNVGGETNPRGVSNELAYRMDFRGLNDSLLASPDIPANTADFNTRFISYNENITSAVVRMSGQNTLEDEATYLPDPLITESDRTVVDAYTMADTAAKAYDALKSLLVTNYNNESTTVVSREGETLLCGARGITIIETLGSKISYTSTVIGLKTAIFDGSITTTGRVTLGGIVENRTIKNSSRVRFIRTLPSVLTLDNSEYNIRNAGTYDLTNWIELNGGSYRVDNGIGEVTIIIRGKDASLVNEGTGNTVTIITDPLDTPSTVTFPFNDVLGNSGFDIRYAIYDNSGTFVEASTVEIGGNVYNNADADRGKWSAYMHVKGYRTQRVSWNAEDGSYDTFFFELTQLKRPEGGPSYTTQVDTGITTSVFGDFLLTTIPNERAHPQVIVNSIQNFLHTDAGLDWTKTTGHYSAPIWGSLSGLVFYLNIQGFKYDSIAGVTPESGVTAIIVSSATHANVDTTNGGTNFSAIAELDNEAVAEAVWDLNALSIDLEGSIGVQLKAGGGGGGGSVDISSLETKAQADARQVVLVAENNNTQNNLSLVASNVRAIKIDTENIQHNVNATEAIIVGIRADTENIQSTQGSLTADERTAIATAVEGSLIDEADGQTIINAIVGAIGNSNLDQVAVVAAVRADLERTSGALDLIETKAEADIRQVTLVAEHNVTQNNINGVASNVRGILADTNELQQNQGDWATATGFLVDNDGIASAIWDYTIEDTVKAKEMMRLFAGPLINDIAGAGETIETFKSIDGTQDRLTSTYNEDGDRVTVIVDKS